MKLEIELTDDEVYYLRQYAEVYENERELDSTANPLVLVQNTSYRHCLGINEGDIEGFELKINYNLITEDKPLFNYEEVFEPIIQEANSRIMTDYKDNEEQRYIKARFLEELTDFKHEVEQYRDYYSTCYFESEYIDMEVEVIVGTYEIVYDTVAYFLTRVEAEKYLNYQKHNLRNPRIYTDYAGINNFADYTTLSKLMLSIGNKIILDK